MHQDQRLRARTDTLRVGSTLAHPLHDASGKLLIGAGRTITSTTVEGFEKLGIRFVLVHPDDVQALSEAPTAGAPPPYNSLAEVAADVAALNKALDALAGLVSPEIANQGRPFREQCTRHGSQPYNKVQSDRITSQFHAAAEWIESLVAEVREGRAQDAGQLVETIDQFSSELSEDLDAVLAASTLAAPDPEINQRAVRLALLGMSMAVALDFDLHHVREVGLCGLVHDWGQFALAANLRDPQSQLSAEDWQLVAQHPLLTLGMLQTLGDISNAVRLASAQVHELGDGSGYPRGLRAEAIHPYARILGVADAYISLTARMWGRDPILPYDAMTYLLHQVKAGRLGETEMRALLQVMSLFPIGSRVRLSDGSEAQVLRRSVTNYMTPIVQRVGANRAFRIDAPHPSIVDLSKSHVKLVSPVPAPDRNEIRLSAEEMDKVLWEHPGE